MYYTRILLGPLIYIQLLVKVASKASLKIKDKRAMIPYTLCRAGDWQAHRNVRVGMYTDLAVALK